jgi:integrase
MLTDAKIKKLKPPLETESEPSKHSDAHGLQLHLFRNGRMSWTYAYRMDGKQRSFTIGKYPQTTLAEARRKRDEARQQIEKGKDPNQAKKDAKRITDNTNSFKVLAYKWLADQEPTVKPHTYGRDLSLLEKDLIPFIGNMAIDAIRSPDVLTAAKRIEERGAGEMARRAISLVGRVIRQAMREGLTNNDPTTGLGEALKPRKVQHMARIPAKELPELLRKIDNYDGDTATRLGLLFLNLTFVRTNEIRFMEWVDVDFDIAEWRIPADKMKMAKEHIVPLSTQALEILAQLKLITGQYKYVFFNTTTRKPYSENAFLTALWRMGFKGRMTGHGFRGLASTVLHEQGYMPEAIERQLSHTKRDKVAASYDFAQHLPYRRQMMQDWANYLDNVRTGKVLQFVKAAS